jgi:hypothetical protein
VVMLSSDEGGPVSGSSPRRWSGPEPRASCLPGLLEPDKLRHLLPVLDYLGLAGSPAANCAMTALAFD